MSATIIDLECWIDAMMKKRSITQYKLDFSGSTSKGEGYLGEVNFVKVIANANKKNEKIYDCVVKSAKTGQEFRKQTPIREAYFREMFVYTKVFPIFEEYQKEQAVEDIFDKFTECYSVCNESNKEALILRNLKADGFEVHDRTVAQNLNHVLYVFRNYGKFHGISLAMKQKKPALFKSLTKNMTDVLAQFILMGQMEAVFEKGVVNVLDILKRKGKEGIAKKLEGFKDEVKNILTNFIDPNNPASVILHGDCWNNNMMFKYEDGNKNQPMDIRFIDFQLSRVASPIFDLSYYLYTCADKSVLQNFDFLLQAYYSSLTDFLKQFDIDIDNIFTFKEFKQQWKQYGKFGLAMAPFIVKMELSKSNEVVDIAESAEKGNLSTAFDFEITDKEVYEERISQVFEHWANQCI